MAAKKRPSKAERERARRGRVLDKMVQGAEDAGFYEKLDVTLDEVVALEDEDSAANSPVGPIGSTVASSHERDMQQDPAYRAAVLAHESEAEDEAALGKFLSFLAQDAALHPERLGDVGELVAGDDQLLEGVEAQWHWLVDRPHPWRRQPWIKGRRLTVGDVLGRMKIEGWSPEETAKEMDLPIEAVKEALAWAKVPDNAALIAAEDAMDTLAADSVAPALAEEGAAPLEMTYELWDFETGNPQGVYPSLLDALAVVRKAIERDGHETLKGLALVEVHSGGHRRLLAQGRATLDDSTPSRAFRAEADHIEVPPRPRRQRRSSPWTPVAGLLMGAVVVLAGLIVGRSLDEVRSSSSGVAASAAPSVAVKPPPNRVISDRHGLILDSRPPTLVSELSATPIATLRGDFFRGAVSPDGRKIAYWETYSSPTVRSLWLLDTSSPAQPRILLTLPDSEIAAVATGSALAWSTDGSGLLIAINSVDVASPPALPDALPLYSALRQLNLANGSVYEVVRTERTAAWFSPLAWDRSRGTSAAAVVGPGGFATGYIVVQDGAAPREGRLPSQTITLQGYVRAAPDASAVLMRGFPENRELYVWPLSEPTQVRTLRAGADDYVARAMWRNPREIVVSLSRSSASDAGDRLEIWNLDGSRRVLVTGAYRLDAVRPDGTAAITDKGAVDLESGSVEEIPGMRRVLTVVVLR